MAQHFISKVRGKGSLYLGWILNIINVRYRVRIFEVWKRLLWVINGHSTECKVTGIIDPKQHWWVIPCK
jgi:hypothetical protein